MILYLNELQLLDDGRWAIRFSCADTEVFLRMKNKVKSFGRGNARWNPALFGGRGGWMIADHVFQAICDSFSNLDEMLEAIDQAEAKPSAIPRYLIPAYSLLGLSTDSVASLDEVKAAYKRLAKVYHPDAGGAHQYMVALNHAHDQVIQTLQAKKPA